MSVTKETEEKPSPKIDFPSMKCSEHKREVILVCTKPECKYKIFLCPKCISDELDHINEHNPLMDYGDFVKLISEQSSISSHPSEDALQMISAKHKQDQTQEFMNHINTQKFNVQSLETQLSDLYKTKCNELVQSLSSVLENEKSHFSNNLNKLEAEVKADKEKDADILKFHELKSRISQMEDLEEIENTMKEVLRRKQAWGHASNEVRQLSSKTEEHYKNLIQMQTKEKPEFVKAESIVNEWTSGLTSLIENIKSTSGCFKGLMPSNQYIQLTIQNAQELFLLTNKMIKEDTEITLMFDKENFSMIESQDAADALQKLQSIKQLKMDFSDCKLKGEVLRPLFQAVEKLTNLSSLTVNFQGSNFKNEAAKEMGEILPSLAGSLVTLDMNFGFTNMIDDAAKLLAIGTAQLQGLENLHFNFRCNKLKAESAKVWGETIEKLKKLTALHVDFSGFSKKRNNINDDGAFYITKAIKNLKRLSVLNLDMAFCGLQDNSVLELAMSIRDLPVLSVVDINFSNNSIGDQGSRKLSKVLGKMRISHLYLNLNSNNLKADESREIVNAFRTQQTALQSLTLFLRNNNVPKAQGEEFLQNLSFEKTFQQLGVHV